MRNPSAQDRDHAIPCQSIACARRALLGRRVDTFRRDGLCDTCGAVADRKRDEVGNRTQEAPPPPPPPAYGNGNGNGLA